MQWEYHSESPGITLTRMNELGAEGWEAYAVDHNGRNQFKRPAVEETDDGKGNPR
jgi:hypothetical protein